MKILEKNQWFFNNMPKAIQIKWKANAMLFRGNIYACHIYLCENKSFDFESFLKCSFIWENTIEGHDYWENISNSQYGHIDIGDNSLITSIIFRNSINKQNEKIFIKNN